MDKEYLLKAIAYKARHRGSKECDLIISTFVNDYTGKYREDAAALKLLLEFIDRDDLSVFQSPDNAPDAFQDLALKLAHHHKELCGGNN